MKTLRDVAAVLGGELRGENRAFVGVVTDSRAIVAGQLFVALVGERFDAHDFVRTVAQQGAAGAMVNAAAADALADAGLPLLVVADTRAGLGDLAAAWRAQFTLPIIAVTGSNGKTTTKDMIAAILRAAAIARGENADASVLVTAGNFNNDIGLPLTLLRLTPAHRAAVIELGMNHPGEIAGLATLLRPSAAVITNAQRAHLQGMGSLEAIAAEKGSLFSALPADGTAAINADSPFADLWRQLAGPRPQVGFSLEGRGEVNGQVVGHGLDNTLTLTTPAGTATLALQVPGRHNAANAMAAAAVTLAAGVPFAAVCGGLSTFAGTQGRLQRKRGPAGCTLVDDTYNANPDSVRAAIDVLAATVGPKVLVLGDMGEIGEASAQYHDEVGGYAKSQGIDRLFALGEATRVAVANFGEGASHHSGVEVLLAALRPVLTADTTVLVKGSRFMRMERVVDALAAAATSPGDAPCC